MLESKIQSKLIKKYEGEGYFVIKIIAANRSDLPDLLLIDKKTGVASFVEVKARNGVISSGQRIMAGVLRQFCKVRFVTEGDEDIDEGTEEILPF